LLTLLFNREAEISWVYATALGEFFGELSNGAIAKSLRSASREQLPPPINVVDTKREGNDRSIFINTLPD
jgi:hypothetical protein